VDGWRSTEQIGRFTWPFHLEYEKEYELESPFVPFLPCPEGILLALPSGLALPDDDADDNHDSLDDLATMANVREGEGCP
jgi:hypothetical protein